MMAMDTIETVGELLARQPAAGDFLAAQNIAVEAETASSLSSLLAAEQLQELDQFLEDMAALKPPAFVLQELHVRGGRDKQGRLEELDLCLNPGDICCVVGPTGAGKSRLLADIEWLAQGDTPTGRCLAVNGQAPLAEQRFASDRKLVAQISQNMNFVMDVTVAEFVRLHAQSRLLPEPERYVQPVLIQANELAGEPLSADTPLTSLSGGQSRALMIADVALLSQAPIVLVDELENAGIARQQALELLAAQEKIVIMATHDPILALLGGKRLVVQQGAVQQLLSSSAAEQAMLPQLQAMDEQLRQLREALRQGQRLPENLLDSSPQSLQASTRQAV